jgi:hypothetical protein
MRHDAAYVARELGKTELWVKRQARAGKLPHSRAGQSYFWDDEDLRAVKESLRVRPSVAPASDPLRPIPSRSRRAS